MTHCYLIMGQNPQGCFADGKGKSLPPAEATRKLDNMAESLGNLINQEETLLRNIMDSDRKR